MKKIARFIRCHFVSFWGFFLSQLAVYSEPKVLFSNFPTLIILWFLETPKVTDALNLPLQTITGCHCRQRAERVCLHGTGCLMFICYVLSSHLLNNVCSSHSQLCAHLFFVEFVNPALFLSQSAPLILTLSLTNHIPFTWESPPPLSLFLVGGPWEGRLWTFLIVGCGTADIKPRPLMLPHLVIFHRRRKTKVHLALCLKPPSKIMVF